MGQISKLLLEGRDQHGGTAHVSHVSSSKAGLTKTDLVRCYSVLLEVGTLADMRKRDALVVKDVGGGTVAGSRGDGNLSGLDGWHFGCAFAGRGDGRNRIRWFLMSLKSCDDGAPGSESGSMPGYFLGSMGGLVLDEAPPNLSYAPLVSESSLEGDSSHFVAYRRLARVQQRFTSMQVAAPALMRKTFDDVLTLCKPPVLVCGGHYMPYIYDPSQVRNPPISTLSLALHILAYAAHGKKGDNGWKAHCPDLCILVNDLHMGRGGEVRKWFWENYSLPSSFSTRLGAFPFHYGSHDGPDIFVVGERVLYNRFDHMRESDHPDVEKARALVSYGSSRRLIMDSCTKELSADDSPAERQTKCTGALIYFLKLVATLGYNTLIQIIPTCDQRANMEAPVHAAEIYGADAVPNQIFLVHTTLGC